MSRCRAARVCCRFVLSAGRACRPSRAQDCRRRMRPERRYPRSGGAPGAHLRAARRMERPAGRLRARLPGAAAAQGFYQLTDSRRRTAATARAEPRLCVRDDELSEDRPGHRSTAWTTCGAGREVRGARLAPRRESTSPASRRAAWSRRCWPSGRRMFSSALAACGPIGSFRQQINYLGDFRALFDYFFPGVVLPGSPVSMPPAAGFAYDGAIVPCQRTRRCAPTRRQALELMRVSHVAHDPADPETVARPATNLLRYNVSGSTTRKPCWAAIPTATAAAGTSARRTTCG